MHQTAQGLKTFYTIILTQTFSLIGSRMTGLAIGIWIFNETGNAAPLTLTAFFATLPRVITFSIAGVLADRWDRRYVMVISDFGQGIATLFLMLVFLTERFELWHLYTVAVVQAIFSTFQGPAFQASITTLIPDNHRDRANAIQELTGPASGVIAPIITGFLFVLVGVTGIMAIDLFTFLVAVLVIFSVEIPSPPKTEEGSAKRPLWRDSFYGLQYLWNKRPLFLLIAFFTLMNFLTSISLVLNTPYLLARTGSEALLGTLLGIMSFGGILGGVLMSVWGGMRPRIYTVIPAMACFGIFLALYGLDMPLGLRVVVLLLLISPIPIVNATVVSIIQAKVAPDVQGRVFASITQLAMLITPIAFLVSGPLADKIFEPAVNQTGWDRVAPFVGTQAGAGIGLMLLISGTLKTIVALTMFTIPSIRNLEADLPDYETLSHAVSHLEGEIFDTNELRPATSAT